MLTDQPPLLAAGVSPTRAAMAASAFAEGRAFNAANTAASPAASHAAASAAAIAAVAAATAAAAAAVAAATSAASAASTASASAAASVSAAAAASHQLVGEAVAPGAGCWLDAEAEPPPRAPPEGRGLESGPAVSPARRDEPAWLRQASDVLLRGATPLPPPRHVAGEGLVPAVSLPCVEVA